MRYLILFCVLFLSTRLFAAPQTQDWVSDRLQQEQEQTKNPFLISFYKPNYLLPFSYTTSPYHAFYNGKTPDNQKLMRAEFNFQLSFKVPVWHDVFGTNSTLYAAYTQKSFWQAYNNSAFFRATNYEPELFLSYTIDTPVFAGWRAKFLNAGFVHESNGQGGVLERTWNRVYVESILANRHWMARVKLWLPIKDSGLRKYNPNIARYMGYGEFQIAYKTNNKHVFSVEARNNLISGFNRGATKASWSFPLLDKVKGYVQVFNGYGQSLNEYNHRTSNIGIGIAINDWI
ncbi:MAG: phospholipase A [Gammaproteobacteria bacterium]